MPRAASDGGTDTGWQRSPVSPRRRETTCHRHLPPTDERTLPVHTAVIYYSGAHALEAQAIAEASLDDLEWADAVIFGTPTRYGNVAAQLKQFIDASGPLWAAGKLANKVYAGFVSTGTAHGGQESTLLALANTFYHWGGVIVGPGYLDPIQYVAGNPYGPSHTSANGTNPPGEVELAAAEFTGRRVAEVANALRTGGMGEFA